MCVTIIKNDIESEYDYDKPLFDQVNGSSEVIVSYKPLDNGVEQFLQELQKCAENGTNINFNIKIKYNNSLPGFKMKKQFKKTINDISINDIIKLMVLSQLETDKKLEEISSICLNRENPNVK